MQNKSITLFFFSLITGFLLVLSFLTNDEMNSQLLAALSIITGVSGTYFLSNHQTENYEEN
jgi:hypothetical protein